MSGLGSASAGFAPTAGVVLTQTAAARQETDWFGTVRGRLGWLATPNVLLFGTGGFAYGRVSDSANWMFTAPPGFVLNFDLGLNGVGWSCTNGVICFAGNSSAVRSGWTAGGGAEWLLDQHWSAKIEYLFVDLGTDTVRVVNIPAFATPPGFTGSSFNAAFRDQFNIVRLGLNYHF